MIVRLLIVFFALLQLPTAASGSEQKVSGSAKSKNIVAAGFGFQDAETSSITVKTYDAQSGEVLSADTYELDIKEDGPPSSHPQTRIFAGGVGVGSDGLSGFILRVYDAANGKFLWEGRLNLGVGNNAFGAMTVKAQIEPRAMLSKILDRPQTGGQPYFVLRAVNPETGQVIWRDEFSTHTRAKAEYISRSIIGMIGTAPRDIDFRIMMPDEAGRRVLWEDQVVPLDESDAALPSDDTNNLLPWGSQRSIENTNQGAI